MGVTTSKPKDITKAILEAISGLTDATVYVGIPGDNSAREDGDPANNALIGYVHEYGSPEKNIPARPFLIPGVADAQDKVNNRFKKAAELALEGNRDAVLSQLEAAGLIASTAVKNKIRNGPFAPLAPATLKARQARRAEKAGGIKNVISVSIAPLIDTGQMLAAVTYFVKENNDAAS